MLQPFFCCVELGVKNLNDSKVCKEMQTQGVFFNSKEKNKGGALRWD
jgi:hypothetical protein